jgi:hypothetical protein
VKLIQVQREAISLYEHQPSSEGSTTGIGDVLKLRQVQGVFLHFFGVVCC